MSELVTKLRVRCRCCRVLLSGAPIPAIKVARGWQCADRSICRWRIQRANDARQLRMFD